MSSWDDIVEVFCKWEERLSIERAAKEVKGEGEAAPVSSQTRWRCHIMLWEVWALFSRSVKWPHFQEKCSLSEEAKSSQWVDRTP